MRTAVALLMIALMLALAACDGTAGEPPAPHASRQGANELDKMISQMETATVISRDLADSQARATTRADATRQHLVLQQQQTRIAGEAIQTQTVFASNVAATASARTATASRAAEDTRATQTAQSVHATATREAAFATATAHTQNALATSTRDAVIVAQTRESASKTATSDAANARATKTFADATATVVAANVLSAQEKAEWERRTEMWRAITTFVGWSVVLIGGALLVGLVGLRFANSWNLRVRTIRDANGVPFVLLPTDRDGRQQIAAPTRSPGAIIEITPPQLRASNITTGAVDADVTKRDQAVSLMLSASARNRGDDIAGALEDGEQTDEPNAPAQGNLTILKPFEPRPLALDAQPSRLALPIGVTERGAEMWISLNEVTHALIGGPTGMGKSNFLHGWIQSLVRGGQVDLALADGKQGMEFGRYASAARAQIIRDEIVLAPFLGDTINEMRRRFDLLKQAGATNLAEYNRGRDAERLAHQVIVVDELFDALTYDGVESALAEIARKGRAAGIQLVMSAQLSDAESVPRQLRTNTTLRIAFACVSHSDSQSILGRAGAEKIEKTPGRLLVFWGGQIVQAQAFRVALPPAFPPGNAGALPPPSALDDTSRQIVEYALREGRGMFVVTRIASALGIRQSIVNRVALNFEKKGWLSGVEKDDGGQNLGRRILPPLAERVGNVAA